MNYNNFSSRVVIRRLPAAARPQETPKPVLKKPRKLSRFRLAPAVPVAMWMAVVLLLGAVSVRAAEPGAVPASHATEVAHHGLSVVTKLVLCCGLGVAAVQVRLAFRGGWSC